MREAQDQFFTSLAIVASGTLIACILAYLVLRWMGGIESEDHDDDL